MSGEAFNFFNQLIRPQNYTAQSTPLSIYKFRGASLDNILQFRDLYRDPVTVTLTDNYRSAAPILTDARSVITQGSERLENVLAGVDKTLAAHHKPAHSISQLHQFGNEAELLALLKKAGGE